MYDINHIKYLYIKDSINNAKLLNDILSVNLAKKIDSEDAAKVFKVFDYIDGIVGNSNFELFQIQTKYEMKINKDLTFSKEEYSKLVSGITYPYLILGIDNCETNFESKSLKKFTEFTYQTILTTRSKQVIQGYDYFVHALYKDGVKEEFDTIKSVVSTRNRTYLLVEGKYDVAWFETGIKLLGKQLNYRVIPCGGFGNIEYVKQQLEKEGFHTLVITDGDVMNDTSLKKDIIELYGDIDYINKRFHTEFKKMPNSKRELFRAVSVKDDVVKKVLSSWSRKGLTLESEFVKELHGIITKYESRT